MNRHEHVGVRGLGTLPALDQIDEIVAISGQHRAHARLAIDARRQRPCNRERDVLFVRTGRTAGTGIIAAVPGIDRDDDRSLGAARCVRGTNAQHRYRRRLRR